MTIFSRSGTIYTVHEKDDAKEPSQRIVLVREGFSFWALVFNVLWLLAHKCWRMALYFTLLLICIDKGGDLIALSSATKFVLQFGAQYWLGCVGNDCRRISLQRSGYEEVDVVTGESELLAERRYFDRLAYHHRPA